MKSNRSFNSTPARNSPPITSEQPPATNEQIAALAHAIWLDRGCPVGHDLDHWLEAERLLGGEVVIDDRALDPDESNAGQIDRELDRIVSPPRTRSPTSL